MEYLDSSCGFKDLLDLIEDNFVCIEFLDTWKQMLKVCTEASIPAQVPVKWVGWDNILWSNTNSEFI